MRTTPGHLNNASYYINACLQNLHTFKCLRSFISPDIYFFVGVNWKQGSEHNRGKLVSREIGCKICQNQAKNMAEMDLHEGRNYWL